MNQIASIGKQFTWVYEGCKKSLLENKRGILMTAIAGTAIAAAAFVYKRLYPVKLTEEEKRDLADSCQKYSPQVFADRLSASLPRDAVVENPNTPGDWFNWMGNASDEQLLAEMKKVDPTYRERIKLSLEDERAHAVQTWAINLEPIFAFIRESSSGWKGLLGPIQSSPRLAYTILFNGMAPFAAQAIWNGISNRLPQSLQEIGNHYVEHQVKIALISSVAIGILYWKMKNEKGFITNLTENFARFRLAHNGFDQIESYAKGIREIQNVIRTSNLGALGSNILWFYPKNTHSTFTKEIERTIAEMAAAGRGDFSGLQVVELDLNQFMIEYRSESEVVRGWNETSKYFAGSSNRLVIFRGFGEIKPFLLPKDKKDPSQSGHGKERNPAGKMLAKLINRDIENGRFRCLIEMDERDQQQMQTDGFARLFTSIRAPDVLPNELQALCHRLYVEPELAVSYKREEINELFTHLIPLFDSSPMPPDEVLDILRADFRQRAIAWRSGGNQEEIQKNERALEEAEQMKEKLLQRVWRYQQPPQQLRRQLLLVEKVVLPLLRQKNRELQGDVLAADLVLKAQQKFRKLLGPCTNKEEERLLMLPELLGKIIHGQEEALKMICDTIYQWRKVPPLNGKPLVLFFAGPPAAGKSETATQIAYHLNSVFGIVNTPSRTSEANVKRINLNRKKPGGFIGWDKVKAEILEHLLYEPATVVILEEWDKMAEEDKSNLLELLDDTKLYQEEPWGYGSTNGPYVDKSSAVFILTTNIDAESIEDGIKKSFKKEVNAAAFRSRVDALIPFQKLEKEGQQTLIKHQLEQYVRRGVLPEDQREKVERELLGKDHVPDAREIQRVIQKAIAYKN